jgi:hypothetical protein
MFNPIIVIYKIFNFNKDINLHREKAFNNNSYLIPKFFFNHFGNDNDYDICPPNIQTEASFADMYIKGVIACILNPKLLESPEILNESKIKAKSYLKIKNFSIGAYSESKGLLAARRNLVKFYMERDEGYKIDEEDIFLTNGGNNSYDHMITLIHNPGDSILVPNPCYPLYLAYNTISDLENIFYDVNEKEINVC